MALSVSNSHNFKVNQNATFKKIITWKDRVGNPVKLSDCHARMHIRSVTGELILELTDENGRIAFNPLYGQIILNLTPADTAALPLTNAVYDLYVSDIDTNVRLLEGNILVSATVTT